MVANSVYQSKAAASSSPTIAVLHDLSSYREGEGGEGEEEEQPAAGDDLMSKEHVCGSKDGQCPGQCRSPPQST